MPAHPLTSACLALSLVAGVPSWSAGQDAASPQTGPVALTVTGGAAFGHGAQVLGPGWPSRSTCRRASRLKRAASTSLAVWASRQAN